MLTLTLLVRRNLGVIAFALIVVAFVVVIAGVALTPARSATPLGDPNAAVVEPTLAPPDSLPPRGASRRRSHIVHRAHRYLQRRRGDRPRNPPS